MLIWTYEMDILLMFEGLKRSSKCRTNSNTYPFPYRIKNNEIEMVNLSRNTD